MNAQDEYTLDDFIAEERERDPKFRKVWDESQDERELGDVLIDSRLASHMTQQELSAKTGVSQGDISRIERAIANPSLKTLKRLADAMGMRVKISFEPKPTQAQL